MGLTIRRGATKTILLHSKQCNRFSKNWTDLGTILFRFEQGKYVLDKELAIDEKDPTVAIIRLTQEETLRFKEGTNNVKYQIFSILGPEQTEVAAKSEVFLASVLPTIFNEVIHNE